MSEKNAPKPKPSATKRDEAVVIYDAVLDEDTLAQHAALEAEADMEVVEEVVATPVVEEEKAASSKAPKSEYAVVSGKDKDEVRLSAIVFENVRSKKSLSVHHLQRRLREWGINGGYTDRDGWYGVSTRDAVHEFQKSQGLPVGDLDLATLQAIFENDDNVRVLP